MQRWRLYIDESGDHTYKNVDDPDKRYLGITGVLIKKDFYDREAQPRLEALKRSIFRYDPDDPPILVRSSIKNRKSWFYVLQDQALNARWETELLQYVGSLLGQTHIFTVVIDKQQHLKDYPTQTFDPYTYSFSTLLNRVRGYLVNIAHEQADVIAESRGRVEDDQLRHAYQTLVTRGANRAKYGDAQYYLAAFPSDNIVIKKKNENVAGLQIADIFAYGQKLLTIKESNKPFVRQQSTFTNKLNELANRMVNRYGRYMLE